MKIFKVSGNQNDVQRAGLYAGWVLEEFRLPITAAD